MIAVLPEILAWLLWLAVLACTLGMSALYSAAETSVYIVNKVRMDLRAETGYRPAVRLAKLISNPNNLLAVLLTGNNLANYVATFAVSTLFVMAGAGDRAEWYTLAVATPLLFILGESVPKNVATRLGDGATYRLAGFVWWSSRVYNWTGLAAMVRAIATGIVRLAGRRQTPLGRGGIAEIMAEGAAAGTLTHMQSVMADRIVRAAVMRIGDVMIPLAKVVSVRTTMDRAEIVSLVSQHNYSRFPVVDDQGTIVGVADLYDLLEADRCPPPESLPRPLKLPFFMTLPDAIYHMQDARSRLAVVTDDRARPVGIVTIKDLLEEIVGEIEAW